MAKTKDWVNSFPKSLIIDKNADIQTVRKRLSQSSVKRNYGNVNETILEDTAKRDTKATSDFNSIISPMPITDKKAYYSAVADELEKYSKAHPDADNDSAIENLVNQYKAEYRKNVPLPPYVDFAGDKFDNITKERRYAHGNKTIADHVETALNAIPYAAERALGGVVGAVEGTGNFARAVVNYPLKQVANAFGDVLDTASDLKIVKDNPHISKDIETAKKAADSWKGYHDNAISEAFKSPFRDAVSTDAEKRYNMPEWVRRNVGDTFESAGAIVPAVALEVYTGGASPLLDKELLQASAKLTQPMKYVSGAVKKLATPSNIVFGTSAAQSYANEAKQEGATNEQALAYGTVQGFGEVLTEMIFGGFAGTEIGESLIDFSIKNPAVRKAVNLATEGGEEVIMEAISPIAKKLTYDPGAALSSLEDYGEAFKGGVLLSLLMGAGTYPIKRMHKQESIKTLNAASNAITELLPDVELAPLQNNAKDEDVEKRQKEVRSYSSEISNRRNEILYGLKTTARATRDSISDLKRLLVTDDDIQNAHTDEEKASLTDKKTYQLDLLNDMEDYLNDVTYIEQNGLSPALQDKYTTNTQFTPTHMDRATFTPVNAVSNDDGTFTVIDSEGAKRTKQGAIFDSRYVPIETFSEDASNAPVVTDGEGYNDTDMLYRAPLDNETDMVYRAPLDNETVATQSGNADLSGNTETKSATTGVAYTSDNEPINFRWSVVSSDDLVTSTHYDGTINPNYPQELQPRDRTRATSQEQIRKISNTLIPNKLGESASVSDGAPIIGADNIVESGNGRVEAIRLAYKNGKANRYSDFVKRFAAKVGITETPNNPILVRVRESDVDRADFVRKANQSNVASMSASGTAQADAQRLDDDTLSLLVPNERGEINTSENHNFISSFINNVVPSSERGNIIDSENHLSRNGLDRVRNALFTKAYGDVALLNKMSESLNDDVRNLTNILIYAAPKIVAIKNGIAQGTLYNFDFSQDISQAAKLFISLKQDGMSLYAYDNQIKVMDDFTNEAKAFTSIFEQKNRGAKQATNILNLVFKEVTDMGNPNQISMDDGRGNITKMQIIQNAVNAYNAAPYSTGDVTIVPVRDDTLLGMAQETPLQASEANEAPTANETTPTVIEEPEYKHLYNEKTVSKAFLNSVNPEIENAVLNIRSGNLERIPNIVEVAELSDKAAKAIGDFVGFNVNGFTCKIERDRLVHIENRHGINGNHDQSLSDPKDTARMGFVANNTDNIDWVLDNNGNRVYDKQYNDKNNRPSPVILLSSKVDGTYCLSEAVPDSKNKTVWITSARIQKADVSNQVPNGNHVTPQLQTSETPLSSSSATNRISQEMDIVNTPANAQHTDRLANADETIKAFERGEISDIKSIKAAADVILNSETAIKAGLAKLSNAELNKRLSIMERGRYTKKLDMVDGIYIDMLSNLYYTVSGSNTMNYMYDGTDTKTQIKRLAANALDSLTQERVLELAEKNKTDYEAERRKTEARINSVKHPQTLEEFAYKKRYFGLSDEETVQFEELYAKEQKAKREGKKASAVKDTSGANDFLANIDNYTVEKTTHTKTGEDVWVVKPKERLETEAWKRLNAHMKALGGSYWRGNQGWNFKKDPTTSLSVDEEPDIASIKNVSNAEKLKNIANGMQKAIDDKFKDRLTNTAKRAREAASAEAEGDRLKRIQDTIRNIAVALEGGEEILLDKIDNKAQVENLMKLLNRSRRNRIFATMSDSAYDEQVKEQDKPYSNYDIKYAEYPLSKIHENIVEEYIKAAEGKTGYKQITDRLKKAQKSAKRGYITVDTQLFNDIDKIVKNLSTYRDDFWNDGVAERNRLVRMGVENTMELRAYLREFMSYLPERNAEAEKQRSLKAKERELANSKIEGFFPTPKKIVERMLDEADIKSGEKVLEPSAGKGNIADEIKNKYPESKLDVVEWNASLNELLSEKGHNVVGNDFLQTAGEYDKIVMNPPFEKGQDIDHVRHAYDLLNPGGRIVAIMGEGSFSRSDKKATEFREWLNELGGTSEKLPDGSFKSAERSTGVNTRLVVIDKSGDGNNANVKYSIDGVAEGNALITSEDVSAVQSIPRKSVNDFTGEEIKKTENFAKKYFKELGTKSPFFRAWFGDWRENDKSPINVTAISDTANFKAVTDTIRGNSFYNIDTGWANITVGRQGIDDTVSHSGKAKTSEKALSEIRALIENAVLLDTETSDLTKSKKSKYTAFMHKLYAPTKHNGVFYVAKITIEEYLENGNTKKKFYNLQNIEISPTGVGFNSQESTAQIAKVGDNISISDLFNIVKQNDRNFNPKPCSVVVNSDGTPKVVYHGSTAEFSVFKQSEDGALGRGYYFAESKEYASGYTLLNGQRNGNLYEVFLRITNPFEAKYPMQYDVEKLKAQGYDGIHHEGNGFWVAFEPTQIKSATDNIGTFNEENPDIRYSISENFESNYDNWVSNGRPNMETITVGATSEALLSIGVKNSHITWDTSKINSSLKKHSYLKDEILKQLPDILERPIIIMQSKKSDSRLTLFGEVYDPDGLPMMAVLELLPTNRKNTVMLDEIKVVSTHSRKSKGDSTAMAQTQSIISTSKILYIEPNKKRTDNWLSANRLQLPLAVTSYGSINRITYPIGNVNSYYMQNSKNDEGAQGNEQRNSLLSRNGGRDNSEGARITDERVGEGTSLAEIAQSEGREDYRARSAEAKSIKEAEGTTARVVNGVKINEVNDLTPNMTTAANALEKYGYSVHMYIGSGKTIGGKNARGFIVDGKEIYLQWDAAASPLKIGLHEIVHTQKGTGILNRAQRRIIEQMTQKKFDNIADTVYRAQYASITKDAEKYADELVCDVLSGLNTHGEFVSGIQSEFWGAVDNEKIGYDASTYAEQQDAGGNGKPLNEGISTQATEGSQFSFGGKWKPSKTKAREFAQTMNEIDTFCFDNGIDRSRSSDSYYFTIDGQKYRVSNHTVEASNAKATNDLGETVRRKYHENGRENDVVYITASKTRIMDIYNDLKRGYTLDKRGNRVTNTDTLFSFDVNEQGNTVTEERESEILDAFDDAKHIPTPNSAKASFLEAVDTLKNITTRTFERLPEAGEKGTFFAEARKEFVAYSGLRRKAQDKAQHRLKDIVEALSADEFDTFAKWVYFADLVEEANHQMQDGTSEDNVRLPDMGKTKSGELIPLTVKEAKHMLAKARSEATEAVRDAVENRRSTYKVLTSEYVKYSEALGFHVENRFTRENYYRHDVFSKNDRTAAMRNEVSVNDKRSWLHKRNGSTLAINTDCLAVEYGTMLQMGYDIEIMKMLTHIQDKYDIKAKLENQARKENRATLDKMIADEDPDNGLIAITLKEHNRRISIAISRLSELAAHGMLYDFDGAYASVVNALANNEKTDNSLFTYVSSLAEIEETDDTRDAIISAKMLLKATSQRLKWVKETLGSNYVTWENLVDESSYSVVQPRRGRHMVSSEVINQDVVDELLNNAIENGQILNEDLKQLIDEHSISIKFLGANYRQWVIPTEIAQTMHDITNTGYSNAIARGNATLQRAWKWWVTSGNPLRGLKYTQRNVFGDIDAILAGNPAILRYSVDAVKELRNAIFKGDYTAECREWADLGGYTSTLFANEVTGDARTKLIKQLGAVIDTGDANAIRNFVKKGASAVKGVGRSYKEHVQDLQEFREAILRYSAYKHYKHDIEKYGKVRDYTASKKSIVDGLASTNDKAYQLSKDLLGAYDEVSIMGKTLRRQFIPFWSFTECNFKRYFRLVQNTIMAEVSIPEKIKRSLLRMLSMSIMPAIMFLANHILFPEDEKRLPSSVRNVAHITLGSVGDYVFAFRGFGSLPELLEWVGLDDFSVDGDEWKSPINKIAGMITPFAKLPVELIMGITAYPDVFMPSGIRSRAEYIANQLGVPDVYRAIHDQDAGRLARLPINAVTYMYNIEENAYYDFMYNIKFNYKGGEESRDIYKPTAKDNAIYNLKGAIKRGNTALAMTYFDRYIELGGTAKGIHSSFQRLNPKYGFLNDTDGWNKFVKSLNGDEIEKLKYAQSYYEDTLKLPDYVMQILKDKSTTENKARSTLRFYMTRKYK